MVTNAPALGPGTLTIGSEAMLTNFSGQVRGCKVVPEVTIGDSIDTLDGGSTPGDRDEKYTLEVTLQSDFGHNDSRTEFLWEHKGEVHDFVFIPNNALARQVTGQIVVEAIEIGGEVKSKPSSDVTFQCVGEPVIGPVVIP